MCDHVNLNNFSLFLLTDLFFSSSLSFAVDVAVVVCWYSCPILRNTRGYNNKKCFEFVAARKLFWFVVFILLGLEWCKLFGELCTCHGMWCFLKLILIFDCGPAYALCGHLIGYDNLCSFWIVGSIRISTISSSNETTKEKKRLTSNYNHSVHLSSTSLHRRTHTPFRIFLHTFTDAKLL